MSGNRQSVKIMATMCRLRLKTMARARKDNQVKRDQLTDQEWQAVGNLFHFLRRLRLEGKIGRKAA